MDELIVPDLCSFALSKTELIYQSIYLCRTCQPQSNGKKQNKDKRKSKSKDNGKNSYLCCCSGCAEVCHRGHDVAFFSYGKAYCDCGSSNCKLLAKTHVDAKDFLPPKPYKLFSIPSNVLHTPTEKQNTTSSTQRQFIQAYHLEGLSDSLDSLLDRANKLVAMSKDTFWLDSSAPARCGLEALALRILKHHCTSTLNIQDSVSNDQSELKRSTDAIESDIVSDSIVESIGAEWWVQVKDSSSTSSSPTSSSSSILPEGKAPLPHSPIVDKSSLVTSNNIGIDLHYDKDENAATYFSCGIFPALSTVTYLSDIPSLPTVVFDNIISDPVGRAIPSYAVSYPRPCKHIVFEGNLLHGAPQASVSTDDDIDSDEEEMKVEISDCGMNTTDPLPTKSPNITTATTTTTTTNTGVVNDQKRVTFLVNIWVNHKPSGINPLPEAILHSLQPSLIASPQKTNELINSMNNIPLVQFRPEPVVPIHILPSAFDKYKHQWVKLPFVSQKSAWGKGKDEVGLVLKCWQPSHLLPQYCESSQSYQLNSNSNTYGDGDNRNGSGVLSESTDSMIVNFGGGTFHIIYPHVDEVGISGGAVLEYEDDEDEEEEDGEWEDINNSSDDESVKSGVVLI